MTIMLEYRKFKFLVNLHLVLEYLPIHCFTRIQRASQVLDVLFLLTCRLRCRTTFFRGEDEFFVVIFIVHLSSHDHVFVFLIIISFVPFRVQTYQYYLTTLMDRQKVVL